MESVYKIIINGKETIVAKHNNVEGYVLLEPDFLLINKDTPVIVERIIKTYILAGPLLHIMSKQFIMNDDEFPEPHMSH